jgi:hypothetical protein
MLWSLGRVNTVAYTQKLDYFCKSHTVSYPQTTPKVELQRLRFAKTGDQIKSQDKKQWTWGKKGYQAVFLTT